MFGKQRQCKTRKGKKKRQSEEKSRKMFLQREIEEERIHAQRKDQNSQEGVQIDHLLPIYIEQASAQSIIL